MILTSHTKQLIRRLRELLPVTEDEIMQRGITELATARIVELRQRAPQLSINYGSLESLEERMQQEGISPDDHTLYTDCLEWRAVRRNWLS